MNAWLKRSWRVVSPRVHGEEVTRKPSTSPNTSFLQETSKNLFLLKNQNKAFWENNPPGPKQKTNLNIVELLSQLVVPNDKPK